jgi:mannose/fructose/N-acetylgalactosamine-specific phosphotransferase system component IIC
MEQYILLSIVGGILAVDDRAGWQSLLAQPVFAGLLVGFLLGQPQSGLGVGLFLEFVWLSILPMRGTKKPDQIAGTVVGAGTTCILINSTGDPRLSFLTAIGVLMGLGSGMSAVWLARPLLEVRERKLSGLALAGSESPAMKLGWAHFSCTFYLLLIEAAVIFILLSLSLFIGGWLSLSVDAPAIEAAKYWEFLLPVFGITALVQIYWRKHSLRFLFLSMLLGMIVLWIR